MTAPTEEVTVPLWLPITVGHARRTLEDLRSTFKWSDIDELAAWCSPEGVDRLIDLYEVISAMERLIAGEDL